MNSNFKTYPLKSISINEAKKIQFKIVSEISREFQGLDSLKLGDLGVKQPANIPDTTAKVEKVLARIFGTEDAILLSGSGTGALRWGIFALATPSGDVLVHDAPIYPTTVTSLKMGNINPIFVDFNDLKLLEKTLKEKPNLNFAIVQYTRQKIDDSYDYGKVIKLIKKINPNIKIMTDDNYAVFKTGNIGTDFGADISTFSTFKILGPEHVGAMVGKKSVISKIRKENYSGGSQVQGWQAMEVLRGMAYAPVALAIQAEVVNEVHAYFKKNKIQGIENVFIANAQSKVLIVQLSQPIAEKVLITAEKLGALPHPVGAESKYEIAPLFFRVSGTFRKSIADAEKYLIRINPNRAGSEQIIEILTKSIKENNVSKTTNKKK